MTRRLAFSAVVVAALIAMTQAAFAATKWTKSGSGNATAKATSVGTGNTVTAPSTSTGSVTLSWTAKQIGGNDISTYSVTRYPSSAATVGTGGTTITCPTSITTHTVNCSYTESTAGTFKYTETPFVSNWRGGESAFSGNTAVMPYSFAISTIATQTAGTAFGGFTVQLRDNGVNTATFNGSAYAGVHTVGFSGAAMASSPNGHAATPTSTSLTFNSSGQATAGSTLMTLYKAQSSATLTATDSANSISGSTSFAINSAGVTFSFSGGKDKNGNSVSGDVPKNASAGFSLTVPVDAYSNPFTSATNISVTVKVTPVTGSWGFTSSTSASPSSTTLTITSGPSGNTFTIFESGSGNAQTATLSATTTATGFTAPTNETLTSSP